MNTRMTLATALAPVVNQHEKPEYVTYETPDGTSIQDVTAIRLDRELLTAVRIHKGNDGKLYRIAVSKDADRAFVLTDVPIRANGLSVDQFLDAIRLAHEEDWTKIRIHSMARRVTEDVMAEIERVRGEREKLEKKKQLDHAKRLRSVGIRETTRNFIYPLSKEPSQRRRYTEAETVYIIEMMDAFHPSKDEAHARLRAIFSAWCEGHTARTIGAWLGISEERVNQDRAKFERRLRWVNDRLSEKNEYRNEFILRT